jgi:hypothetical protein
VLHMVKIGTGTAEQRYQKRRTCICFKNFQLLIVSVLYIFAS